MGTSHTIFFCSKDLTENWFKPIIEYGLELTDFSESHRLLPFQVPYSSQRIHFCDISTSGIVSCDGTHITVCAGSDASHLFDLRRGILMTNGLSDIGYQIEFELMFTGIKNFDERLVSLAESLTRIFVGSGAEFIAGTRGFKEMYLCTRENLRQLLHFLQSGPFFADWDLFPVNKLRPSSNYYFSVKIIDKNRSVYLHTGPGIVPGTAERVCFCAINYDNCFFDFSYRRFVKYIKLVLFDMGFTMLS